MAQIRGGSPADRTRIEGELREVVRRLTTEISNAELQSCIRGRVNDPEVIVRIGGEECHTYSTIRGYTRWYEFGPFTVKSDEIHLCLSNIDRQRKVPAATIMHELAHTCCWDEGGGMGVPENGQFRLP